MNSLSFLIFSNSLSNFDIVFTFFCIVTLAVVYFILDSSVLKPYLNNNSFNNYKIQDIEVRLFFVFLTILILFSETLQLQFLKIVPFQYLSSIIVFSSLFIVFKYSVFNKSKKLVEYILIIFYFLYQTDILIKMYEFGNNLVYFSTLIILFYSASIVIKKITLYLTNVFIVFVYLFILLKLGKIASYDFYVLITSIIGVMLLSYGKRISLLYVIRNLEFSKELVNNSSTILCAFDKFGNLLYVNKAVSTILGYTPNEVKGKQFWLLTQDPDFVDIDYNEIYQSDRTYVRKLTSKSGKLHYISWSEKKINNNLFVSSGQDITSSYLRKQDYKILFDNISEIIYELDKFGNFTKINSFAEKVCGYSKNELYGLAFKDFIFPEDINLIQNHYKTVSSHITQYKPIEYRILKKDGGYIWVSQIVNIKLTAKSKIHGFTAVARVITEEKEAQLLQNLNAIKSIEFQNIVNDLYTLDFSGYDLIDNIKNIIEKANNALNIDRVSIWKYSDDGIRLEYLNLFDNIDKNTLKENDFLNKNDFPHYFASIQNFSSLIVQDVELNPATSELYNSYFKPNDIKSLIDQLIKINGKTDRIICFEQIHYRTWTDDEIRFTRTIANYLALIIERNDKQKVQYLLQKRGQLLSSLNNINHELTKCNTFIDILNCNYSSLGELLRVSRLFFYENKRGSNYFNLKYRWLNTNIQEKTGMHTLPIFNIDDYPEIQNQFTQQEYFYANRNKNLSESLSQLFDQININTLLIFPLYINGNLFGFIGLDDSDKNISWQKEDIDIFISFAKNLESIIERVNFLGKINENKQKFELLANNIPAGVYLLKYKSRNSSKIYFNDKLEQITGYSLNDFYTNKISLIDLYHPEDKEIAKRAIYIALKTRGTYTIKSRIIHKTGKIVNIEEYGGTIVINDRIAYIEGVVIVTSENE